MKATKDFIAQLESGDWAWAEFQEAPLVDKRLNKRLSLMARDFAERPGASIPQACSTPAQITGAYRFLENDFVQPEQILVGHRQASLRRLAQEPVVLAVQDTTSFNFSGRAQTRGLGPIGTQQQSKAQGLWLHTTLSLTPSGLPLGLIGARFWSRSPLGTVRPDRSARALEEKESGRWQESWQACPAALAQMPEPNLWVNISDMEGDIYQVFAAALAQPARRVELLVRSRHNRKLREPEQRLWDHLAQSPLAGTLQVRVPRQERQPARLVTLQIRFVAVEVQAPKRQARAGSLRLWAVEARESRPPAGRKAILWRLLTTLPVTTAAQAIEKVRWYAVRWNIEVFHKIMKSVCRAEAHQEKTDVRLERVLMIDLVVAWRIQVLTQVGRQNPEWAASDYFAQAEWKALGSYLTEGRAVPVQAPSLGQMIQWIGQLRGFLRSKSNPHPGPITLARGLARLSDLAQMWSFQNCK
jgi:hypothetical protein